jgi:multidrug efflux system membrane fusion protein
MEARMDGGTDEERGALEFEDDRGAARSVWVAVALLVAVIAWMASGFLLPSEPALGPTQAAGAPEAVAVATRVSTAEPVTLTFRAEGQAQPDRDSALRAEASGDVAELLVAKGEEVAAGQVLARLSTDRVEADLARARAELARAERELANAEALIERGVATADRVAEASADAAAAAAQVAAAEEAVENTAITAPFAGRIETLTLDAGEFVQAGAEVGRIVDNRPLTVAFEVPQQSLDRVRSGQTAQVRFITGELREGTVAFVGTAAAAETRTFPAEITVPNADGAIPAGISAEIVIPTAEALAHFIAPSIVSLAPDGRLGVNAVEDGRVVFHEVEVVRAEMDGIWVTGPPPEAELVVVGQGYVRPGEPVRARPAEGSAAEVTQ